MVHTNIEELVINMVKNIQTNNDDIIHMDIILSGGAFNAIYLVGCLHFLREMERNNKIMIHRISTCSASSIVALFYLIDNLKLFETKIYNIAVSNFKNNKKYIFSDQDIISIFSLIETTLYEVEGLAECEILKKINYKLFITYFDIKKCKRVVKKKYRSLHDVFETIKKSSYIPFITMNNMMYENRYIDGWQPYIFTTHKLKKSITTSDSNIIKKKQLFINLIGIDKIKDSIVLKNNKENKDKVINGILDIYSFFYQNGKYETAMCMYLNDQSVIFHIKYNFVYIISYVVCIFLYLYIFIFQVPSSKFMNASLVASFLEFVKNVFHRLVEYCCI